MTASSERESFPRGCGGRAEHPAYDRPHGVCGTSVGLLIIQWTGPVPVPPRLQTREVTPLHHHNMKSDSQSLEVGHIWYEDLTASSAHIRTVYRESPGEVVEIMLYGGVVRENGLQLVVCRRAGKCLESSFDSVHARSSTTSPDHSATASTRGKAPAYFRT